MGKKILIFTALIFSICCSYLGAQVAITPTTAPDAYFFVDDLWKVTLFNGGQQPVEGRLGVVLEDYNNWVKDMKKRND